MPDDQPPASRGVGSAGPQAGREGGSADPQASKSGSPGPRDTNGNTRTDRSSDRPSDRPSDRDKHSTNSRGANRHTDRQAPRQHPREARDGPVDRHQDKGGPNKGGVNPRKGGVNPNSKQAELLAFAASDMNAFRNDGSFMEKFAASQGAVRPAGSPAMNEDSQLSGNLNLPT